MDRGDLSDEEWAVVGPLLPSEHGRWARFRIVNSGDTILGRELINRIPKAACV